MKKIQLENLFNEVFSIYDQSKDLRSLKIYLHQLAEEMGYNTYFDTENLVVIIPSSEDKKNQEPLIIQTHLDGKNIKAQALTIANILLLLNNSFDHPKIYLVFTDKKHFGNKGVKKLDTDYIRDAKHLINIDSDVSTPLLLTSAGSETIEVHYDLSSETVLGKLWILSIENLKEKSFMENEIRAESALKLLAQMLGHLVQTCQIRLVDISCNSDEELIPSTAKAAFYSPLKKDDILKQFVQIGKILATSYQFIDKDLKVDLKQQRNNIKTSCFSRKDTASVIFETLYFPSGVLLQDEKQILCSNNIYECKAQNGHLRIKTKTLFKSKSLKEYIKNRILQFTAFTGGFADLLNVIPFWEAKEDSLLLEKINENNLFYSEENFKPFITENGIFQDKLPDLDIITLGTLSENLDPKLENIDEGIFNSVKSLIESLDQKQQKIDSVRVEKTNGEIIPITDVVKKVIEENLED